MLRQRHELGLLIAIAICVVVTAVLDSQHNYWANPRSSAIDIIRQTSLLGIFALGAAVVIIAGGIDLSSGSVIAFGGTICATIMYMLDKENMVAAQPVSKVVIATAILGTMFVGFLIGSLHVWLITVIGLPPFVATLATLVGLRSFGRAIVENVTQRSTQIPIYDEDFRYLATSVWIPALIFLVLAGVMWLLLSRTVTGRHLYALGGNEQAAKLSGIRTDRMKWLAYCLSSMLSAMAGILYIGDQAVADPQTLGRGYELNGIASAVVGGCSLQGGAGTIPGTVLGAFFMRVVVDGVAKIIKTGADVYEGLIVGVVVVVAVAFNQLRAGGSRRKKLFPGALGIVNILNLSLLTGALTALMGPKLLGIILPVGSNLLGLGAGVVALALLATVGVMERR
ncbi:MAG: ABC transporter permease [Planctomycetota bacterium]